MFLTQIEADKLIEMPKKALDNDQYEFPLYGESLSIPIVSLDSREHFLVDINRKGSIRLNKCTYQKRYIDVIILIRLEIDGPPHTNPDVTEVPHTNLKPYNGLTITCPHLHLYMEGYMDRWAIPAPIEHFAQTGDLYDTLYDFFRYCNIIEPPNLPRRLFIQ
ncbi:MAG: hypothetical protein M1371_10425 [Actinobacteria bacterium]|nr:hypothetical protein [Actinomycetota bacterium]